MNSLYTFVFQFGLRQIQRITAKRNVDFGQAESIAKHGNEHAKQVRNDEM